MYSKDRITPAHESYYDDEMTERPSKI